MTPQGYPLYALVRPNSSPTEEWWAVVVGWTHTGDGYQPVLAEYDTNSPGGTFTPDDGYTYRLTTQPPVCQQCIGTGFVGFIADTTECPHCTGTGIAR